MASDLKMPSPEDFNVLMEGHPIGIDKIIQGDLRTKTWESDGVTYTSQRTDGKLLYDRREERNRPWFILAYESGKRYID